MLLVKTKKNVLELDLYDGCFHGCQYCPNCPVGMIDKEHYPKKAWLQATPKIMPVQKLLDTLKTELATYSTKHKIFMGNKIDNYQPIERYYGITKQAIEHILNNNYDLTIQTKSSDILRDIELLERFKKNVHLTICLQNLETNKKTQCFASTIHEKLFALKTIHYLEIPHSIKIAPILPETNPRQIIKKLKILNQNFVIGKPIGIETTKWLTTKNRIKKMQGITVVFE